jgi:(p)ppGpp synthase/HD superfamily hydrolase
MSNTLKGSMEDLAWAIARVAHQGQSYKRIGCDWEYMTHIKRVVHNLGQVTEMVKVVGILHDVVEDSDITIKEIHRIFGSGVSDAVYSISRQEDEQYGEYIVRCSQNRTAKLVKGVDMADHILHCVRPDAIENWKSLLDRYTEGLRILHSL